MKNLKVFLATFLISFPLWWGVNILEMNLEDFFFWKKMADNPQILTAQVSQYLELEKIKPIRNQQIPNLEIEAKSAISVLLKPDGNQKILFEKESDKKLPIASLTKLMTAKVVLENYNLSQLVEINEQAVKEEGEAGNFKIGQDFPVKYLLYPLLIESSNDAAYALADLIGQLAFVDLMNLTAKNLGMEDTYFINPSGLDPDQPEDEINYSTTEDLVKLTDYLLKTKPLIWEILSLLEFDLYSPDGIYHHKLKNTNELLGEIPLIVGGKTGETPKANDCLLLVLKSPKNKGYLINVILGSADRFEEMKKLIEWVYESYKW